MNVAEYYKELKDKGTLDTLYKLGHISHVPYLIIELYHSHLAILGKTESPIKDLSEQFRLSRTHVHRYLNEANKPVLTTLQ